MKFFLLFIPFLVVQSVSAQQPIDSVSVNTDGTHKLTTRPKKTKQNVYVELGGAGLALSTNYTSGFTATMTWASRQAYSASAYLALT